MRCHRSITKDALEKHNHTSRQTCLTPFPSIQTRLSCPSSILFSSIRLPFISIVSLLSFLTRAFPSHRLYTRQNETQHPCASSRSSLYDSHGSTSHLVTPSPSPPASSLPATCPRFSNKQLTPHLLQQPDEPNIHLPPNRRHILPRILPLLSRDNPVQRGNRNRGQL